ncbi:CHRD domain-containing protein [Terricaulis sp.]|uniref:CHRD domain-containing protein n=1 Tax=Terricaulis sp. TaxID=2768686 RepID=UPI003782ED26
MFRIIAAAAALIAFATAPAAAEQITYTATLNGVTEPTATGSAAAGTATISVDTATQTIDARIEIHGLRTGQLAQHLAHSRMGPMHLHRYQGDDVTLILPFPFGDTYAATADGFTVTLSDYPYADGAQRTGSRLDFAAFVAALAGDPIFLNVHTEAFGDGEISGRLVPAS